MSLRNTKISDQDSGPEDRSGLAWPDEWNAGFRLSETKTNVLFGLRRRVSFLASAIPSERRGEQ